MARLPAGYVRSGTLASAQGRLFTEGLKREKADELKQFASMMHAAKKHGPPPTKVHVPTKAKATTKRTLGEIFGPAWRHMSDDEIGHIARRFMGK